MSDFDFESRIVSIPDYPEPGVIFKDITPLISDPEGYRAVVDSIAGHFRGLGITKVVGTEARGFFVGGPVAIELGVGFVPVRKPGKLPRAVYKQEYELEYGANTLEMHKDALSSDDRVLVVDDLIATGGSAVATALLCEKCGAKVAGFGFIMELAFLNPREVMDKDYPGIDVLSLVKVN
ncbi:adenine phosphoribosyltransferase [Paratractidigestivibacter sp.]|uniref:adenine phosphoribosyltransferase n=1 Tax=Paratractidigestivibacter sp. TaxID=2847316 RepID=UPI002ABD7EEF|nr:adenine phosphoribosyltransferase [Paratractidigestivibacter sp.]